LPCSRAPLFEGFPPGAVGIGLKQILHAIEHLSVQDGFVLAVEPFSAVVNLAEIDPVLQKIGERTISEGNAAVVLGNFGNTPFGDDAPAVEIGSEFAEGLQFKVSRKHSADGLGFGLVDHQLLVLGVITERHGATGPFALAPGRRDLVPDPFRR
jgi:hypothetical protein